jgi:hypothetical protein
LASGVHIDAATERITLVQESTTFEKEFPNFATVIYILTVYGAIRDIFDIDRLGFGPAIFAYIRILTKWHNNDKFDWENIRAYFISHFRKHQTSVDPKVWSDIDVQLHAAHIRSGPRPSSGNQESQNSLLSPNRYPPSKLSKSPSLSSLNLPNPTSKAPICNNWNSEDKGCNWSTCKRRHICSTCQKNDHTAYNCPQKQ